jgi:hypothetical protein
MARLALDELIDQLLHSNALSLKLTANPLVADRAWHLTENTSAPSPLTIHRPKSVHTTRCSFSISPGLPTRSRQRLPISFIRCFPGSEITSSLVAAGGKQTSTERMLNAGNIVDELRALCQQHPASHHPLFDFLASEASAAQIDYFFKSDSASICFSSIWWRWGWWARCRKPALRLRKICGMR